MLSCLSVLRSLIWGEYKQALVLCARAETFFSDCPASAPFRYYQMSLDCQRRSYEGLARYTEAENILESYIRFAEQIEDWNSYIYGLVLKLNIYFQTNKKESAVQLIENTNLSLLPFPPLMTKHPMRLPV